MVSNLWGGSNDQVPFGSISYLPPPRIICYSQNESNSSPFPIFLLAPPTSSFLLVPTSIFILSPFFSSNKLFQYNLALSLSHFFSFMSFITYNIGHLIHMWIPWGCVLVSNYAIGCFSPRMRCLEDLATCGNLWYFEIQLLYKPDFDNYSWICFEHLSSRNKFPNHNSLHPKMSLKLLVSQTFYIIVPLYRIMC